MGQDLRQSLSESLTVFSDPCYARSVPIQAFRCVSSAWGLAGWQKKPEGLWGSPLQTHPSPCMRGSSCPQAGASWGGGGSLKHACFQVWGGCKAGLQTGPQKAASSSSCSSGAHRLKSGVSKAELPLEAPREGPSCSPSSLGPWPHYAVSSSWSHCSSSGSVSLSFGLI